MILVTPSRADGVVSAREHYEKGTALFDLQRYGEAASEYELAFEAKPDPALLFNIGQAYRFARDYPKAIGAFRSYLRRLPHTPNREEVEKRIDEMQKLVDEQKHTQEQPPGGVQPLNGKPGAGGERPAEALPLTSATSAERESARRSAGRTKKIAGIATASGGVALVILGGVFAGLASSANADVNHPSNGIFDPTAEDRRNSYQAADIAFFALGGAAVAAGAAVYFWGWHESGSFGLSPTVSRDRVGLSLTGSF